MIKVWYPSPRVKVIRGHRVYLLKYLTNIYCKHVHILQLYAETMSACCSCTRTPCLRITVLVIRRHKIFVNISVKLKYFEKLF